MFTLMAMFTTEKRFQEYMIENRRLMYVHYACMLVALYGPEHSSVVEAYRSRFRQAFINDPRPWAKQIFEWDNTWCHDRQIGLRLLEELRKLPAKEMAGAAEKLPLIDHEFYNERHLFPVFADLKERLEKQLLVDVIDGLGITGLKRAVINTTFMHGRAGEGGLLKYAGTSERQAEGQDSTLGRALSARLARAFAVLDDFHDWRPKESPEVHAEFHKFLS